MKKLNITLVIIIMIAGSIILVGCENINKITENLGGTEATRDEITFKKTYDEKMKNAKNPKKLASVNDNVITQTDVDMFKDNHPTKTLDTVILYNVLALEAQEKGVEMSSNDRSQIYSVVNAIRNNKELTNEYCQKTYGISNEKVAQYSEKRLNLIFYYNEMLLKFNEDLKSGQLQKDYPELKDMCEKYNEKEKNVDSSKSYNDLKSYKEKIFDKYYEILKDKYNVKIY